MVGLVREEEEEMVAAAAWEEEVVTAATQVMEIRESRLLAEMVDQVLSGSDPATEATEDRVRGFLVLYIEVKIVLTEAPAQGETVEMEPMPILELQAETEGMEVMEVRAKEEMVERVAEEESAEVVVVVVTVEGEPEAELAVKEEVAELAAEEDRAVKEETRVPGFLKVKKVPVKVDVEVTADLEMSEVAAVRAELVELEILRVRMVDTDNT